ncbi:hypothetical protein ID866_347, partial [Astraeus odoratus]
MAPLPTALDSESLALVDAIERRLHDLSTFQIPRLRTCTGPLATQQIWAAEIREDIDRLGKQIEELDILVDDQRTERARKELRLRVETLRDTLNELRKDSRAALLASKRAIDAQRRSQREELLALPSTVNEKGSSTPGSGKTAEDALMKATNNVTEALQRTMGLMQKELERSVLSAQLLESSTATLHSTSQTHDNLSLLVGSSRQLISALEQTDTLDRLLITAALVFFVLVVLFILEQRVLEKSLRITFWWTRFVSLPSWSSGRTAVGVAEKAVSQGSGISTDVASTLAAASTTLAAMGLGSLSGIQAATPTTASTDAPIPVASVATVASAIEPTAKDTPIELVNGTSDTETSSEHSFSVHSHPPPGTTVDP